MTKHKYSAPEQLQGRVLDVSRRYVTLLTPFGATRSGTTSAKALDVVTGDIAFYEERDGKIFVNGIVPSERTLSRSYRGKLKRMGANIDLLFVITAVGSTLNPVVIDRMLIGARVQGIPSVLVLNKADLGLELTASIVAAYRKIGIEVIECSAKFGSTFDEIEKRIQSSSVNVVALCGVSGVGKSTILNRLVPGAGAKTGELSEKTGQGRQTTSQPRAFLYSSAQAGQRVIIDFPGVQFFGLSHVPKEVVAGAFEEFVRYGQGCRFINCRHLQEPSCAVREAIDRGDIEGWRYDSYIQILNEIEEAREY